MVLNGFLKKLTYFIYQEVSLYKYNL